MSAAQPLVFARASDSQAVRRRQGAIALIAVLAASVLIVSPPSARPVLGVQGTLYAVTGAGGGADDGNFDTTCSGGSLSSLYTLDPADASVETGPTAITIGGNQIKHVNGIAVHPTTGVLYGVMNGQLPDCEDWGEVKLITIDKSTGVATVVGSLGDFETESHQITDIAFDPFGTLYGWNIGSPDDGLVTINTATGDATAVGEHLTRYGMGLAVNSAGQIYLAGKWDQFLHRVSHTNGNLFNSVTLGNNTQEQINNILAFDGNDVLYTGKRSNTGFTLYTLALNGTLTSVGSNAVTKMTGIAFDFGVVTPPDSADLSLDKSVDDPTPEVGSSLTFTLTVANDGPDNATGVEVTDALSSIYTYQSQSGDGTYTPGTGVWDVGTVPDGESRSIDIVVTVGSTTNAGSYINRARITATDTFDPDSEVDDPNEGIVSNPGDIFDEVQPDAFDPDIDATASLTVNGPTRAGGKTKGFKATFTNVGSAAFNIQSNFVEVFVNGTEITCKGIPAQVLQPGDSVSMRCTYSPANIGFGTGATVTYEAIVNVPLDGTSGNDTAEFVTTAT
jgi:uncharacterized repeat protein (TIGR01451 family)